MALATFLGRLLALVESLKRVEEMVNSWSWLLRARREPVALLLYCTNIILECLEGVILDLARLSWKSL